MPRPQATRSRAQDGSGMGPRPSKAKTSPPTLTCNVRPHPAALRGAGAGGGGGALRLDGALPSRWACPVCPQPRRAQRLRQTPAPRSASEALAGRACGRPVGLRSTERCSHSHASVPGLWGGQPTAGHPHVPAHSCAAQAPHPPLPQPSPLTPPHPPGGTPASPGRSLCGSPSPSSSAWGSPTPDTACSPLSPPSPDPTPEWLHLGLRG